MEKLRYIIFGNGASVHLLKWAKELSRHTELYVVSPGEIPEDFFNIIPKERCFALHMKTSAAGGNSKMLGRLFQFCKIIKGINPDVVNPHYITSHGLIAAIIRRFLGGKYIIIQSAWGTDIMVTPERSFIYRKITRFALNSAALITSDARIMTDVIAQYTDKPVMTFPFGLDSLPLYHGKKESPALFFSNRSMEPSYKVDEVIRWFSSLQSHFPDSKLIVGNDGSCRKEIEKLVKNLALEDQVSFTGFLNASQQAEIYSRAQFYMSMPLSDTTSVSLLEAMAHGCIPLVSDIPANREWITDNVNGLFVKKGLPEEVVDIFSRKDTVAEYNRSLIREKAIFPKCMDSFISEVYKLTRRS